MARRRSSRRPSAAFSDVLAAPEDRRAGGGPARSPGRPRSAERDETLVHVAQELLAEVGYDLLTMGAVAERAGASKNTLYRRWPDKRALAAEACAALDGDEPEPDTGELRGDLRALARRWTSGATLRDAAVVGLISPMARDPELRRSLGRVLRRTRAQTCAPASTRPPSAAR